MTHNKCIKSAMQRMLLVLSLLIGAMSMTDAQVSSDRPRPQLPLELLPDTLAICRLSPEASLPAWASADATSRFLTISRTHDELSITTLQSAVPADVRCERDYQALRVRGPLSFDLVGVLAAILDPLANAGISVFAISTFDTDYVLMKSRDVERALATLRSVGHRVVVAQ